MDILKHIFIRKLNSVKSDFHRFLYDRIDWHQPLVGIMGQRGVGKTTMMIQRIQETDPNGETSFYASLDNLWFADHTLMELAEELVNRGVSHLYLDEVHKMPGWERQVKNLYDSYDGLKIVFTSSSLLEMNHSIGDLSRRVSMHMLPGLSFREFIEFEGRGNYSSLDLQQILYNHHEFAPLIASQTDVLRLFGKYLEVGFYPFYKSMGKDDYYSRLQQVVTTVIEQDIPAVEKKIEYETLLKAKRLTGIIAGAVPYLPNIATLAGLMGTNRNQLLKLFDLLDRAGIIREIFTDSSSPKALAKPNKILLDNSSLMHALGSPHTGSERESMFASWLSVGHRVNLAKDGDFMVDGRYLFEVGGRGKGFAQIRNIPDSFLAVDGIEAGFENKIPLWLFGFLY